MMTYFVMNSIGNASYQIVTCPSCCSTGGWPSWVEQHMLQCLFFVTKEAHGVGGIASVGMSAIVADSTRAF